MSAEGAASAIFENAALELLVGLGWLAVGILVIDWMADRGRKDGSIEII